MAITFEGYERRINQINKTLNEYGIKDIEEAKKICDDKGIDVYNIVKSYSAYLLRKCLLGLHCRCCNRNQER